MERLDIIEAGIIAIQKAQAKTDAQMARTEAQMAKTDAKLKETAMLLGNIGVNLGLVAEEFFYYALKDSKKFGKVKFDEVDLNVSGRNKKVQDEFDIVMYNGNTIAIIEVKHKVHPNDLQKLKTSKLENFKTLYPDYAQYNYLLGIGGFSIPQDVMDQAKQEGIAILRQKGNLVVIEDKNLVLF